MSDLVKRLRKHVEDRGGPKLENGAWQMMLDAANEIERLRAENEIYKAADYEALKS